LINAIQNVKGFLNFQVIYRLYFKPMIISPRQPFQLVFEKVLQL